MAVQFHIDAHEVAALADAWARAPQMVAEEMSAAVMEATGLLEREVKERTPVGATSVLRSSISARGPSVLGERVVGEVSTSVRHAIPVELGRRPGRMPPVAPLADWAQAKLGVPEARAREVGFLIARKIARKGTEGRHMFRDAFAANEAQVEDILRNGAGRVLARLAEGGAA